MRQYDKTAIAAAFSTVARLVREGQPVIIQKINGLNNPVNRSLFRAAVTHNFNEKDHGFDLQQIFIVDEKNPSNWTRNTNARNNPKDIELIDRVILAMRAIARIKRAERKAKVVLPVEEVAMPEPVALLPEGGKLTIDPRQLTNDELNGAIEELQTTLEYFLAERDERIRTAKKVELLRTIREMLEGEGFTLEDLLK